MDDKNYNVATIKTFEFTTCIRNHVKHVLHRLIWLKSASKICQPNKSKNQWQNSFMKFWKTLIGSKNKMKDTNKCFKLPCNI